MWKHLAAVLLLLLLNIQKSSYGLKCNSINPEPPPDWNEIDCPPNDTTINPDKEYVCFAISGESLAGGYGYTLTCAEKGACQNESIWAQLGLKQTEEKSCIECKEDRCNEAVTPEDEDGSTTTATKASAVSKISAISSVVITLIVVIVVFM